MSKARWGAINSSTKFMFVKTTDKWTAIHAFINTWLRDETKYCNNCGQDFILDGNVCCENPQYGTNAEYMHALLKQNKLRQETRKNEYASDDKKTLRLGVSILPRLLEDLEEYCATTIKEKLWKDNKELNAFMRRFPMFTIPEKI